ncbi:hypothetical protein D3C86_1977600 [compost metagenome]
MYKSVKRCYNCYCKCFTGRSDNYIKWCDYILYRRFRNIDFKHGNYLLVVDRRNKFFY